MSRDAFSLTGQAEQAPWRYRGCGLDGIYLLNGYEVSEEGGETCVAIHDIEGLHEAIGRHLVLHRKALSAREIRFLRNTLGLTQAGLAARLGNTSQSVARWEKGECEIPGASEKLLRAVFLASLPRPEDLRVLQRLLEATLDDLDAMDELGAARAQFQLLERWEDRREAA